MKLMTGRSNTCGLPLSDRVLGAMSEPVYLPCRVCGCRPTLSHVSPPVARPSHYALVCDCGVAVISQYPDVAVRFWQTAMEKAPVVVPMAKPPLR